MRILNNLLRKVENLDKCMLSHSIKINFETQLYFQLQLSSQSRFMKDFVCQAGFLLPLEISSVGSLATLQSLKVSDFPGLAHLPSVLLSCKPLSLMTGPPTFLPPLLFCLVHSNVDVVLAADPFFC